MTTIVARATAPVASGVGVLRLSGAGALGAALALCPDVAQNPEPRKAFFTRVVDLRGGVLDQGLFLYFAGPRSYTGEDVVELQLHGSPRLLELVQAELVASGEVRVAGPGEFTRRAFLNGRLDLARAEAVADLVAAQSEAAVRAAAAQLRGGLGEWIDRIRGPLLALRADVEGALDFPDEALGAEEGARERIGAVREELSLLLATAKRGRWLRQGARVVLYGPVNAGKSTLFNRLIGQDRALVDAEPGTTRDVLEARLELGGGAVVLMDTAGLREEPGRLESLGIERARRALETADLALLVLPPGIEASAAERWRGEAAGRELWVVASKADLSAEETCAVEHRVSGLTGEGVEALRQRLGERFGRRREGEERVAVSDRHAAALERAQRHLEQASRAMTVSTLEVVAGELRLAEEALAELTGEGGGEALLDAIFERFCIGK